MHFISTKAAALFSKNITQQTRREWRHSFNSSKMCTSQKHFGNGRPGRFFYSLFVQFREVFFFISEIECKFFFSVLFPMVLASRDEANIYFQP